MSHESETRDGGGLAQASFPGVPRGHGSCRFFEPGGDSHHSKQNVYESFAGREKGGAMKKVLSTLELLNDLAICLTEERLLASQVAVLTTIARFPGSTSGAIASHTGLSLPSVGRLLAYLINSEDVVFTRKKHAQGVDVSPKTRRLFFVTQQGVKTIVGLARHMRWSDTGRFGVVAVVRRPLKKKSDAGREN